jgi:hypothetical protein
LLAFLDESIPGFKFRTTKHKEKIASMFKEKVKIKLMNFDSFIDIPSWTPSDQRSALSEGRGKR